MAPAPAVPLSILGCAYMTGNGGCGMAKPSLKQQAENRGGQFSDYWPLASLVLVAVLAGWARAHSSQGGMLAAMYYGVGFSCACSPC